MNAEMIAESRSRGELEGGRLAPGRRLPAAAAVAALVAAGFLVSPFVAGAPGLAAQAGASGSRPHEHDGRETASGQDGASAESPGKSATGEPGPGPESPPLPEGVNDLVRFVDRPGEGALEVVIGPVSLPSGGPHLRTPVQMATLPIEGWLHGYTWSVTDGEGRPLPDRLLHHVNFLDPDARELFAPIPRRVLSAGRETGRQEMPRLLGYPIEAGTRLLIAPMFANPTETDYDEVYLRVRLLYSDGDDRLVRPGRVYPFYLDAMGPVGPKHFEVPPGRSVVGWEGRPAIDGRILAIGGHLHNYGARLRLVDVTKDEVLYEVEPETDERGRVVKVPTARLWWKGGIRISKDHTYRIEVAYENPLDRPAPDMGMGVLGGIVLASPDAEWPPLDRHDPDYVADLRNTLEEPFRDSGHGGHGMHGMGGMDGMDARGEVTASGGGGVDERHRGAEEGDQGGGGGTR